MNSPHQTLRRVARVLQVSQIVAFLLLVGTSALLWRNIEDFRRADLWVDHSQRVQAQIDMVRVTVQRGGLALRNFAISPRTEFIDGLAASSVDAKSAAALLEALVSDNAKQALRAHEVNSEATEIVGWYQSSEVIARRDGAEELRASLGTRVSIDASARLRQLLDEMETEEQQLLEQRRRDRDLGFRSIKRWSGAVILLFLLFTVGAIVHASKLVSLGRQGLKELQASAERDALTGLFNRRAFEALGLRLAGKPIAVVAFDLNDFKPVNDRHGHAAGDAVLRAIGARLLEQSRRGDIAARVGGDEFLILLPGAHDEVTLRAVAERVLSAISTPIEFEGVEHRVGASIGFAWTSGDAELGKLVQTADQMSYQVKREGKSRG